MVLEKLLSVVKDLELAVRDAEKFKGGNASAGVRLRKQAQDAVRSLKELRKLVSDAKAERKVAEKAPGV